jgi:ABC-type uncharacterized transport system auxiliary subunit
MSEYRYTKVVCVLLLLFIVGCGGPGKAPAVRRYYALELQRQGQTHSPQADTILEVRPFGISPSFAQKELVYRTGEFRYESDFYNQFVTDARLQITEQTRRWLSDSGDFSSVALSGSALEPTHILEGDIVSLYGDFRNKSDAHAVMEIEFFLIDIKSPSASVIFSKMYEARVRAGQAKVENLIQAYNQCLEQILQDFEGDLQEINLAE